MLSYSKCICDEYYVVYSKHQWRALMTSLNVKVRHHVHHTNAYALMTYGFLHVSFSSRMQICHVQASELAPAQPATDQYLGWMKMLPQEVNVVVPSMSSATHTQIPPELINRKLQTLDVVIPYNTLGYLAWELSVEDLVRLHKRNSQLLMSWHSIASRGEREEVQLCGVEDSWCKPCNHLLTCAYISVIVISSPTLLPISQVTVKSLAGADEFKTECRGESDFALETYFVFCSE